MDVSVTIDGDVLDNAVKEKNSFNCKRRKVRFDLQNGEWRYHLSCGGYGNGYGVGFSCKEACDLRITDLTKCKEIKTEFGSYLKQVNVFGKMIENLKDENFINKVRSEMEENTYE